MRWRRLAFCHHSLIAMPASPVSCIESMPVYLHPCWHAACAPGHVATGKRHYTRHCFSYNDAKESAMKKLLLAVTLSTLAAPALAEFPVGKVGVKLSPSTDFDLDGLPEGDGTAIGAYGEIGSSSLFAYIDVHKSDLDIQGVDLDIDETRFGVGARSRSDAGELSVRVESYDLEIDIPAAGA